MCPTPAELQAQKMDEVLSVLPFLFQRSPVWFLQALHHGSISCVGWRKTCASMVENNNAQSYIKWNGVSWVNRERCNKHRCPIDCKVSPWTEYSTCTKACAGGRTVKKRSVITKTQYGGKACPNLSVTRRCNSQKCVVAQCHSKQMSCKVRAHYYGRTKCAVGYKKRCAQCDSKSECSQPRVMHAVQVTQSRDMMHLGNVGFKCSSVSGKCVCRCNNHPIACFKKNSVFSARSRTMLGNIYRSTTMQKCSTLCNHHTSCVGWVFTSKNKCYLHTGKAEFVKNGNSNITTYAGLKSGVNGCVVPKAKTCGVHEYLKVIKRPHGDAYFCVECPAGKFLHYTAHSKTKCHSRVQQQISRP